MKLPLVYAVEIFGFYNVVETLHVYVDCIATVVSFATDNVQYTAIFPLSFSATNLIILSFPDFLCLGNSNTEKKNSCIEILVMSTALTLFLQGILSKDFFGSK